jgi:hypothetical protein
MLPMVGVFTDGNLPSVGVFTDRNCLLLVFSSTEKIPQQISHELQQ